MFFLWLGASISISEIFTGGLVAPLGLTRGTLAIVLGHLIGCALLAFGGHLSYVRKENAMSCVVWSFGRGGGALIALCNVIQLIGWTIVMIVQASSALVGVTSLPFSPVTFCLAVLVCVWALIFGSPVQKLNDIAVILLSVLCVVLFSEALGVVGNPVAALSEGMSMTLAVELSIAMPVSWLPLIGDYTSTAEDETCAFGVPFAAYFAGSTLMYLFGLYVSVKSGSDIFAFIAASRFTVPACGVVLLSTLTTAFLDLYSAAVSSQSVAGVKNSKLAILVIGVFSGLISVFFPVERYSDFLMGFLTVIGMVFVPVYAVSFLDFLKGRPACEKPFQPVNLALAALGMVACWLFGRYETWIPTLLTMALIWALYEITGRIWPHKKAA
ncbi:MAG: cytosine permease [Synergistaceae bacterium]|jgi:putative hydroxymethylpyrimidine transporter CytX|nr:cytosine permease [Synergistaceae bacterium]